MQVARPEAMPQRPAMQRHLVGLVFVLCLLSSLVAAPVGSPLILVSIDGFRWDYLQKYSAPTLKALADSGVHARRLTPSFPSKTFPNHYTLVTGRRPEHHGIVSNYFHDPALGASFNKNLPGDNADGRWWSQGEPIWITAEKNGLRSAVLMWPGCDAEIHGVRPTLRHSFDARARAAQRLDMFLQWFDLPAEQQPRFAALYLDVVDIAAHKFGPESPETAAAVQEADAVLARLLAGLAARGLRDTANLVIVSDHGMSEQSLDRVVFLEDVVDVSQVEVESTGPNGGLRPKPGTITPADLVATMRAKLPPQVQVYLREDVPARYHYRDNPRIPPVVFIADDHWNVELRSVVTRWAGRFDGGNHGWDPATPNMGALFVAHGPAFKRGHEFADVDNIHLYNLLCAVLGVPPAPNDGDDRLAREALAR